MLYVRVNVLGQGMRVVLDLYEGFVGNMATLGGSIGQDRMLPVVYLQRVLAQAAASKTYAYA